MLAAPAREARATPQLDRLIERELRDEVRSAVDRLLSERQLLSPGPEDEARIRALVAEKVAAYQRRAATTNQPLVHDPAGLERRLFDGLLRLGPLQPLMDDPGVEEVICNGPRVFAIRGGRKELADVY